jgi:hypothetical protein
VHACALLYVCTAATCLPASVAVQAQNRGGGPPATARASAPIDLTGQWVSVVSEDWRYRMVTPAKGDSRGIPVNQEALQIINAWDPKADETAGNQCKSYGAAAIMRVPGRIRVTWHDENTLRLDTDAGMQTRLFRFGTPAPADGKGTWQGHAVARWERPTAGRGAPAAAPSGGSLAVVITGMRAGYLRKNGVPYSEDATVTEYFDVASQSGGGTWLVVTTIVEDPRYLTQPFIVSSHFKKEADGSTWDPTPCSATW